MSSSQSRELELENELRDLQEKYELMEQDYGRALNREFNFLDQVKHSKREVELAHKVKEAADIKLKKLEEDMEYLLNGFKREVDQAVEAIKKELKPYHDLGSSEQMEVELKNAATTQDLCPLEVGAGLNNQHQTTIKDIDETGAPVSQVPSATTTTAKGVPPNQVPSANADDIDSDDERAIIAYSQKLKRARF